MCSYDDQRYPDSEVPDGLPHWMDGAQHWIPDKEVPVWAIYFKVFVQATTALDE
jgi:hypothetical protein